MLTAVLFGIAASSALVVGSAVGARWDLPTKVTGALLAFASGALISALAVELFAEAFHLAGAVHSGLGLLAGAATFVIADSLLDKYVSGHSGPEQREVAAEGSRRLARPGPTYGIRGRSRTADVGLKTLEHWGPDVRSAYDGSTTQ